LIAGRGGCRGLHTTASIGASPFKGLGDIGILGVPAAIANAVYYATGPRFRSLPITIDQLL
jgi:xanthine dehydrogenase YagR molybdenum-binding subunit